jgi:hypothetical protein
MSARVKSRNPASKNTCATCGANARRQWCRLHDPARRDQQRDHAVRVALRQAKTH